jgi:transposase
MIAERLIHPCSKLATTRLWHSTTLAQELSVQDADEDELYSAMDWLYSRRSRIENKLAKRHLHDGSRVLYDASSSYYEGSTCPLAQFGHNRDGKRGKQIIVYGVLTDEEGRPVSVDVYPGSTGDPTTVPDQVEKLRKRFGLERVVLVGDRGMVTNTQLEKLREYPGLGWISALRSGAVRDLVEQGAIQPSLFDEQNLAEIKSPDYPDERLVVCYNPLLADERARKRDELLAETEKELSRIQREVKRRTKKVLTKDEIGFKAGKVINRFKVGKHFKLEIDDGSFSFWRDEEAIARERALDGIYVVRTSERQDELPPEDAVRTYKGLSSVERLFRTMKGLDILVRPIHHREPRRVRTHIFICMLAYYVEWHMRKELAPLLFDDECIDPKRDPVAPAKPSEHAQAKKQKRTTEDGLPLHSFETLITELGTLCKNVCRFPEDKTLPPIQKETEKTKLQSKAFNLLGL